MLKLRVMRSSLNTITISAWLWARKKDWSCRCCVMLTASLSPKLKWRSRNMPARHGKDRLPLLIFAAGHFPLRTAVFRVPAQHSDLESSPSRHPGAAQDRGTARCCTRSGGDPAYDVCGAKLRPPNRGWPRSCAVSSASEGTRGRPWNAADRELIEHPDDFPGNLSFPSSGVCRKPGMVGGRATSGATARADLPTWRRQSQRRVSYR